MIKRNLVNLVIAGLFAGAAAAHAESSSFPVAAENGPFQRQAQSVTVEAKPGAAAPVYPVAEIQPYMADERPTKTGANPQLGMHSAFPAMAETGPRI